MFELVLEHGGAANALVDNVLALKREYHQRNMDFPFAIIPEQ